jgi:hypothetical protein
VSETKRFYEIVFLKDLAVKKQKARMQREAKAKAKCEHCEGFLVNAKDNHFHCRKTA